ncbi:hypothetical protein PENSPDRAFT_691876 [Peniophora sp. CONT]|nr:hypothetical protein PENSPDRAFT_691876 [Peniophora sp. CONT]
MFLSLSAEDSSVDLMPITPDLPGGKQHWSLSNTPYEREPQPKPSVIIDVNLHFPALSLPSGLAILNPDSCKSLVSYDPVASFHIWRDLYREHTSCAVDYPLWTWTQAFVSNFTIMKSEDAFLRLVRLGLCNFFEEIVCRADFLEDGPVLVVNVLEAITGTIACVLGCYRHAHDISDVRDMLNGLVVAVCRIAWEQRTRFLLKDVPDPTRSLQGIQPNLERLVAAYYKFTHETIEIQALPRLGITFDISATRTSAALLCFCGFI